MSANILNAKLADALLDDAPLLSLSIKIKESLLEQILLDLKSGVLSIEQWAVLKLVAKGSAIYPSQLGQLLNLALPQITRIVDDLEDKKLISRQVDVSDRRKFKILLSHAGESMVEQLKTVSSYKPILDESLLSNDERILYSCIYNKCVPDQNG